MLKRTKFSYEILFHYFPPDLGSHRDILAQFSNFDQSLPGVFSNSTKN